MFFEQTCFPLLDSNDDTFERLPYHLNQIMWCRLGIPPAPAGLDPKLWNHAKQVCPHLKVSLHCCGGVYPLLGDMIAAGLDAINPVQFNCADMELARLKREFGKDLVFWGGGCDTRRILPHGTPEEVRRHVAEQVQVMAPGGGFVFQQVHNILADVPPENIAAMFEAVRGAKGRRP